jgi:hypothetical protein
VLGAFTFSLSIVIWKNILDFLSLVLVFSSSFVFMHGNEKEDKKVSSNKLCQV